MAQAAGSRQGVHHRRRSRYAPWASPPPSARLTPHPPARPWLSPRGAVERVVGFRGEPYHREIIEAELLEHEQAAAAG